MSPGHHHALPPDAVFRRLGKDLGQFLEEHALHSVCLARRQDSGNAEDLRGLGERQRHLLSLGNVDVFDQLHRTNLMAY